MKKHFCILFCLALLGCQEQNSQKPGGLIPDSKLVRILADIHIAEAQVESTVSYPDTALMVFNKLQKEILERHNVTGEEFRQTYNYYTVNIPEMDRLYETVVDTLIAREANYVIKGGNATEPQDGMNTTDSTTLNRARRGLEAPSGFQKDIQYQ